MNRIRIPRVDRFETSVLELEQQPVEPEKIVFYGDSGFTRWSEKYGIRPLEKEILGKDGARIIINHGLGGSTTDDLLYYYPRMVKAWKPKVLVFMTYENDYFHGYSPADTMELQSRIIEYARRDMPGISIYACDKRPTIIGLGELVPWKASLRRALEYNELLTEYCARHDDVTLVRHISSPLFFENPGDAGDYEKVRRDIFIEDRVHFNQRGYDLYAEFFRGVLDEKR